MRSVAVRVRDDAIVFSTEINCVEATSSSFLSPLPFFPLACLSGLLFH